MIDDELYHAKLKKNHKYIAKIGEGKNARYFYTQAELDAYKKDKQKNDAKKYEKEVKKIANDNTRLYSDKVLRTFGTWGKSLLNSIGDGTLDNKFEEKLAEIKKNREKNKEQNKSNNETKNKSKNKPKKTGLSNEVFEHLKTAVDKVSDLKVIPDKTREAIKEYSSALSSKDEKAEYEKYIRLASDAEKKAKQKSKEFDSAVDRQNDIENKNAEARFYNKKKKFFQKKKEVDTKGEMKAIADVHRIGNELNDANLEENGYVSLREKAKKQYEDSQTLSGKIDDLVWVYYNRRSRKQSK